MFYLCGASFWLICLWSGVLVVLTVRFNIVDRYDRLGESVSIAWFQGQFLGVDIKSVFFVGTVIRAYNNWVNVPVTAKSLRFLDG